MRNALRVVSVLIVLSFETAISAQAPKATGQSYWGLDFGATYSWYNGQKNFLLPMRELLEGGGGFNSIASYAAFDGLGSGPGLVVGGKLAIGIASSLDLEAKLRYVMNYSSASEDQMLRVTVGNTIKSEPVANSYALLLHNVDCDLLAHLGISGTWYAAAGVSYSSLLDNHITGRQVQRGGDDWTYKEEGTQAPTALKEISVNGRLSNFFAPSRTGLLAGGGTTFSIDQGPTFLDAEILLSIPLTRWLQDSGESAVNSWVPIAGTPPVIFPQSWYVTFTVGVRFPFGGSSAPAPPTLATIVESKPAPPESTRNKTAFLKGTVTDSKGQPIQDASITAVNLSNGRTLEKDTTDKLGRYSIRVIAPGKYSVTADKNGYLFGTAYFEVDESGHILSKHPDIKLSAVANGRTPLLLFFDFNSADLKSSSYPELDRVVRLMSEDSTMEAEIAGYTDSVGSEQVNKGLSERRANAVKDYLVKNGIAKKRVTAKGYGEESPIADNGTDEGRAENRRVEFVVLSK